MGRKFTVMSWLTYLYFSPDGELLYRLTGNAMAKQRYLQGLQAVRQTQAGPLSMSSLCAQLHQAVSYHDRQNLTVSADSARRAMAALRVFRQEQAANRQRLVIISAVPVLPAGTAKTTIAQAVSAGSPPFSFPMELNNAAWNVYQTGTRNSQYLWRAAQWSKRTVDLAPAAYNYDTLAHLLFRLRFFYEAEAMQQHAVAMAARQRP